MILNDKVTIPTPDIVILADGDYPTHVIPLTVLNEAKRLYCCDHAGLAAMAHGLKPTAIVGDGDSLTDEQKTTFGSLYHQVDEQDYNDLTKTLRLALEQWQGSDAPHIAFLGTTGKREDHTLANISLMMWYYRHFDVRPTLFTDHGLFTPAQGAATYQSFASQQVSIFNFGCTRLESTGLKWNAYAYEELWQGSLNEATGDAFTLNGDGHYLVFQTYEPKNVAQNTENMQEM